MLSQNRPRLNTSEGAPGTLAKSVKVHDDTHRALKRLKAKQRSRSMDEVIRGMIRTSTGSPVGGEEKAETEITAYVKP